MKKLLAGILLPLFLFSCLTTKKRDIKVVQVISTEYIKKGNRMNVTFVHKTDTTILKNISKKTFNKKFTYIYKSF